MVCLVLMAAVVADCAAHASVAKNGQRRRTWLRSQNVSLNEMYLRLRFGSTGQDSFPCTSEVATITSDAIRSCLDSFMGPLCGMPNPTVSLGTVSCSGGSLVLVDGGRVDFLASDSMPASSDVYDCIPKVVESDQCLSVLRQGGLGSLYQVRVMSSTQYTIAPTPFPTFPPSTPPPTRFPVASPTGAPTASSTEVPTEGATTSAPTAALLSDAPSGKPSISYLTTSPPVSEAPTTIPVAEDTSVPTPSPTPLEATTLVPTGAVEAGAGPIPSNAVSEENSSSSSSRGGPSGATTPMVIGVAIGGFLLLALLVGLERERRRKRQNEDDDDDVDDGATTQARGSPSSTGADAASSSSSKAAAAAGAGATAGLWMMWMSKRGRRDPKDAPSSSSKRALPLAAEQWDDTGSVVDEGSYRGDLRLMAMVEVGQEEDEGHYANDKSVVGAPPPTGNESSPASTAKTGVLSSSSSTASAADTDKTNYDNDDGSIETAQAIGAAATSCPQPACFAGDACAKTTFASLFGYYRGLASSSKAQPLADESREAVDAATATEPAVEDLPNEFEPDRSWNPDDNSVGSRDVDPGNDLFQPCSPANMTDDQSSLVALASQNSGSYGAHAAAVPGVLSYRTMPVEITPDEDLIDVPLRPVTFCAADTVAL
jgi:hypothetical protein